MQEIQPQSRLVNCDPGAERYNQTSGIGYPPLIAGILLGCCRLSGAFPFPLLVILTDKLATSGLDQTFFDLAFSASFFILFLTCRLAPVAEILANIVAKDKAKDG